MTCLLIDFKCDNCHRWGLAPAGLVSELGAYNAHNKYYTVPRCAKCREGRALTAREKKMLELLDKINEPVSARVVANRTHLSNSYVNVLLAGLCKLDRVERRRKKRIAWREYVYRVKDNDAIL